MKANLLILLIIILCSCGSKGINEKNASGPISIIDLLSEPESETAMVSEISTNIDYIPLETTENSLVGSVTKILTCANKIYIKNSYNEILCFDKNGKFLSKLNRTGRGPEEYTFIADFDVSSENKTLLILSNNKILIFNNTDTAYTFAKSINLKQPFPSKIDMIPETNNILLSIDPRTGTEASLSLLINTYGDTLQIKNNYYKFEAEDRNTWGMANESLHFDSENSICFKEEFSDTVFFINKTSNNFQPKFIIDSHGKGFSPRVRYDREYAKKNGTELYRVYSIIEFSRYIIYSYEHNMSRNKIIYDKSLNKKFKIAVKSALKDDISGGPFFDPDYSCDGNLYSSIDALSLKKYVASEDFKKTQVKEPKKNKELKKLAESLNETDNPVLIVVTPKK